MSQLDQTLMSARLGELIADAQFTAALRLLDDCVQLGPGDPWVYGMRALLLLETGDLTGALTASATAVQQAPLAAFAHWTRGVALLSAGILPAAQRAAERAVALDPEEPDTHVLLARVYLQNAHWELARIAIADADAQGADEEELMPLRAAIAAGRGLEERARETWRAFASKFPANALARTGHAWTLLEEGDVKGAHGEFQQARALDPTNSWAQEGLEITQTRLMPVHRRWPSLLWGRAMQRREETMVIAGSMLASVALSLLGVRRTGILLPLVVMTIGAGLPMLDAWRREIVTR